MDFATAPVRQATLFHSVRAPATLKPAPGGDALVTAQADGIVLAAETGFPQIGDEVAAGQIIARIAPNLSGERDYPSLLADRDAARAAYNVARTELARVEGLFEAGAVARNRVEQANADLETSRARLNAAQARVEGAQGGTGGSVAVRAPVSGRIARVDVGPGSYTQGGNPLFRIVDPGRMRLVAQIAEIDAQTLGQPQGAWFSLLGHQLAYDLANYRGRLVAAGGAVDPIRRTMPVIFEFENSANFAAGALATARVRTSQRFEGPVIPANAIVDEAGQNVVFVMEDAENWRRQPIRVAVRDGNMVGIASGLEPGMRVVTEGAYLVHLAASGPAEAGHGHAH
ncbi:efflux RND transporter periplasmic adaptor subunit [Maricaulaceae bacterium NA33B04]|nr:efflux RND transporter periplasmic adaptor subunit [Maricaulaceae bacterium NA33B04]